MLRRCCGVLLILLLTLAGNAYAEVREEGSLIDYLGSTTIAINRCISSTTKAVGVVTVTAGVPYVAVISPQQAQQLAFMLEVAWRDRLSVAPGQSGLVGSVSAQVGCVTVAILRTGSGSVPVIAVVVRDGDTDLPNSAFFDSYGACRYIANTLRRAAR